MSELREKAISLDKAIKFSINFPVVPLADAEAAVEAAERESWEFGVHEVAQYVQSYDPNEQEPPAFAAVRQAIDRLLTPTALPAAQPIRFTLQNGTAVGWQCRTTPGYSPVLVGQLMDGIEVVEATVYDALKAEQPKLWTCPDCAFRFDARHEDEAGGYSCPLCAEMRLQAERDTLAAGLRAAWGHLQKSVRSDIENGLWASSAAWNYRNDCTAIQAALKLIDSPNSDEG